MRPNQCKQFAPVGRRMALSERPLLAADSTGRCNTLSECHCPAKMSLNQRHSQRLTGPPSSIRWNTGNLVPTTTRIASSDNVSRREPTFRATRPFTGISCRASTSDSLVRPSDPKPERRGFVRVLRRPIETAVVSGRSSQLQHSACQAKKNPAIGSGVRREAGPGGMPR